MLRKLRSLPAHPMASRFSVPNAARRTLLLANASLALAVFTHAPAAHAQAVSGDFAVQRFDPAAGPHNYFTTRGARTDGKMVWSAGLVANYSYRPFDVRTCVVEDPADRAAGKTCSDAVARSVRTLRVIENEFTGNLMGTLTPIPRLQLAMNIPVSWVKGQGLDATTHSNTTNGINSVGVGDAQLEAKVRIHGQVTDPFVLGAAAFVTAPLGHATAKNDYIGDTLPSAGLRLILDGEKGPFSVGANLAGVFRDKGQVGTSTVGSEGRYSVAAGFRVSPIVRVLVDGFGTTRFSTTQGENTFEIDGGFQFFPLSSPLAISLGGGTALVEGVGVPKFRGILGLTYALEKRDRDGDGIDDSVDQCPTEPEDFDGHEDSDGCPDPDNDLDTIPDKLDKCPDQPEDQDGFEDRDGCPDPDNDKDGIPDVSDQCPNEPETKNGYKDDDGCPDEADRDNDGVPDSRDQCPDQPEDTDGFQDTDGCPDLDNDNDGIPDAQDECIDEPENYNHFEDADGCPDDPKAGSKKKAK
ncbi:MAG: thrombospondin type 3 repeat-containing protein [Polyangiaceae bacterium]